VLRGQFLPSQVDGFERPGIITVPPKANAIRERVIGTIRRECLVDPDVRGAAALDSEILGRTLQPRETVRQFGSWSLESTGHIGDGAEIEIPPPIREGRCCAREIGAAWIASWLFDDTECRLIEVRGYQFKLTRRE